MTSKASIKIDCHKKCLRRLSIAFQRPQMGFNVSKDHRKLLSVSKSHIKGLNVNKGLRIFQMD